ncbi:MAG: putative rane protein [Bryobacterales bacterium]|nr:putative rane protein [Bryobacterales bacterium]
MRTQDPNDALARVLSRLEDIEARLRLLEAARNASPDPEPSQPVPSAVRPPAPARQHLETQVGLTWLNRVGVLTVVLGFAFFFKYAVDSRLIGETGRVLLGVLTGCAALGLAEFMSRRGHRVYAQGITGAGISILYLSLYSAFGLYHLLPHLLVFILMFSTTAMAVALSLRYDSIAIAALGFTGGYLTPLLLSTNDDRPWALFGYVLILGAGGMALVSRKSWRYLEPLLLAGTSLVYLVWFSSHFEHGKEFVATVFALAFYALFWAFSSRATLIAAQILGMVAIAAIWSGPETQSLWINLLLGAAGLTAAERRSWPQLAFTASTLFWFSGLLWRGNHFPDTPWFGIAILTTAFLLFLGYVFRWCSRERNVETPAPYLGILALDGLLYFVICHLLLNPAYHAYLGLFAVAMAAIHLFVAWLLRQRLAPGAERPIVLSVGVAITFLILAVPIQFSQFRITMSWALEGAAFAWIANRTGNRRFGSAALVSFTLALVRLCVFDAGMYSSAVAHPLIANARLLTFLVTGVCFWLGAHWAERRSLALVLYIAGHFVVLWALLMEIFDWAFHRPSVGTVSASVLLAVYGIALVVLGVTVRSLVNRLLGLVLLALVVVKLYLYDVWQLEQTFRFVAFVVLGILLLTASFLYSRFRFVVDKLWDRQ